jgi:hypothetical protein
MNTIEKIIAGITSGDSQNVWFASCEIISLGQDSEKDKPLIRYLSTIKKKKQKELRCVVYLPQIKDL